MGQFLSTVQEWLAILTDAPAVFLWTGDAVDGDEQDTVEFDGFEQGLSRSDIPVVTGLTAEEYVRRGLERHGGRLRQQEIVKYTGWSEATVSRTLSAMEDDGQITRVRLGRENVVCLPDDVCERDRTIDSRKQVRISAGASGEQVAQVAEQGG